jgi:L-threonylcarbamoyladenylate synthase
LRDKVDLVIDGDRTPRGIASTIVDVSGDTLRIVREGAVPWREIEEFLGG